MKIHRFLVFGAADAYTRLLLNTAAKAAVIHDEVVLTYADGEPIGAEAKDSDDYGCGVLLVDKPIEVGRSLASRNIELEMLALALTAPGHEPSMYQLRVLDSMADDVLNMSSAQTKKEKSWLIGAKQGKGVKANQRASAKKRNKRRRK